MSITLLDKIQAQVADLQAGLQSSRPIWTKGADIVTLEQQLNKSIYKIIANQAAQDPKLPPLHKLNLAGQQSIFQAAKDYAKTLAAQVLANIQASNNKENFNKKINATRKFREAFLIAVYALYDQLYLDKQYKKLARLLEKINGKHQEESAKLYPQEKPKEAPAPIPILKPENMEDYELADQLHALGLTVGATHDEIEQAYQDTQAQCARQNRPVPVAARVAHNTLMATPANRLLGLAILNPREIQHLATYTKVLDMLNPDREVSLTNIRAAFFEMRMQQADSASPQATPELRRMGLTMEKLERHYGKTPEKPLNLAQELLGLQPAQSPSRLGQTPTLTMRGAKK